MTTTLALSDEAQAEVIDGMLTTGWTIAAATAYVDVLVGANTFDHDESDRANHDLYSL